MPTSSPTTLSREARRAVILRLIRKLEVRSQAELRAYLEDSGTEVNQATLSRDLRDLGVLKGPHGYRLPGAGEPGRSGDAGLVATVRQWLESTAVAQNQVLIKTPPGGAQPLALAIDRGDQPLVLGTLAGDDTVLVICRTPQHARRVARRFEQMR